MELERGSRTVDSYTVSAAIYDRMVGAFAFEHWRENFERLHASYGFDISCIADVACGTGLAAAYLAERGAHAFACDLSAHMLREAVRAHAPRRIAFARQDMRYLQPPAPVSLLNCATDSLNHLLRERDVRRALASFRAALKPGGHAIFDMNTAWQLREGSDTEAWEFEVDGQHMRWLSAWDERSQTHMLSITFYDMERAGGGLVEVHRERAYETDWMMEAVGRSGFSRVDVMDASGLTWPTASTRRLLFVACA